ncbi:hypothetical protein [Brevundimonas sp.]|uniref:hypothetical protein n=1 Tax=Brevundimonas sp. TaxID=1871086 RepID=UPI003566B694
MLDAKALLTVANGLVGSRRKGAPNQASLRRAVSTAYYALFHALAAKGADTLVGRTKRKTSRYSLIYRAFEHSRMRQGCEAIDKAILAPKIQAALGIAVASQELRDVAVAFVNLQKRRHWADYSASGAITRADAQDLVDQAKFAIDQLNAADAEERANWLALLLTSARES